MGKSAPCINSSSANTIKSTHLTYTLHVHLCEICRWWRRTGRALSRRSSSWCPWCSGRPHSERLSEPCTFCRPQSLHWQTENCGHWRSWPSPQTPDGETYRCERVIQRSSKHRWRQAEAFAHVVSCLWRRRLSVASSAPNETRSQYQYFSFKCAWKCMSRLLLITSLDVGIAVDEYARSLQQHRYSCDYITNVTLFTVWEKFW